MEKILFIIADATSILAPALHAQTSYTNDTTILYWNSMNLAVNYTDDARLRP
ncbi:MAG: hypothetical protein ABI042_13245 [Verrucomicrobiota bacterium]